MENFPSPAGQSGDFNEITTTDIRIGLARLQSLMHHGPVLVTNRGYPAALIISVPDSPDDVDALALQLRLWLAARNATGA